MTSPERPVALTIAGSDSSGGAGVAADLKTFEAHGLWGAVAITAVTAQNTLGVQTLEMVSAELVRAQIASVVADLGVAAAKTGMLGSAEVVTSVATTLAQLGIRPLVVDPVLVSGRGQALTAGGEAADAEVVEALVRLLLPLATVVTPNLAEAAALTASVVRTADDMVAAARALAELGPELVMVKGGHLGGARSPDCLVVAGSSTPRWLDSPRLTTPHTHGTGCVLSAAICAGLARGLDPVMAATAAKQFVTRAIAAGLALGAGTGPVDPAAGRPNPGEGLSGPL